MLTTLPAGLNLAGWRVDLRVGDINIISSWSAIAANCRLRVGVLLRAGDLARALVGEEEDVEEAARFGDFALLGERADVSSTTASLFPTRYTVATATLATTKITRSAAMASA